VNIGLIASRNARLYGDKTALVDANANRQVTWRAFNDRVNRLSHALLARQMKKGDRVAIYSRNSLEYLELFMACAKTGVVLEPMNWRFTPGEIATTLCDGTPRVILVSSEYADCYRSVSAGLPFIELVVGIGKGHGFETDYDAWIAPCPNSEPETINAVGDDDLYFICYTGGTTGVAKGAMITHRNAYTTMVNMTVAEHITSNDVYIIMGQMFHIAVLLPHGYMFHGAKVIILNFEPRRVLQTIQEHRVTSILAISTMMNYIMDVPDFHDFDTSTLRLISYGGGPFAPATLERAMQMFPGIGFLQYMGQTEVSIMSAWLGPEDHVRGLKGNPDLLRSCGREALLCDVRVVDENEQDVPRDGKTPGEMIVRGDNVMRGYWNLPELTAETLRGGWCHTGDIATWDADGYMYVVDRKKDMIVSGGENIFSARVEEVIYRHPAVKECAVIGVPHPVYGETVKACVVLRDGCTATAEEIIDSCRPHLASYQKPTSVEFLDALPKSAAGKLLKRVLRDKYWAGQSRRVGGA
jgi:acyl-CoA synthetase (AMP-forming)/AMP-acid ligase II